MNFGLGLVLSFTDNATTGINNAVNSLNNLTETANSVGTSMNQLTSLSALSVISNKVGDSFLKTGSTILGGISNILNKTKDIGGEFEDFDVTLTALYGGASQGAKKSQEALSKLFDFAKKSPLEVGDVKDMIVTLQSQGINAFDKTTGAITGTRQELLSFLTDLKSFKPEVSNLRFKMAIQNYIGSGEKKMMRTVFDMGDIEDIIGHSMSDTAEGRMNDIVEMVEKKGLTGLSKSMAKTWRGVASNVSDAFTQMYYSIASNGVFKKLKQAFLDLSDTIISLNPEELSAFGKTVAQGLNIVVKPITVIAKKVGKLISSVIKLCQTRPKLVKMGIVVASVAGAFMLLIGVIFKLTSAMSGISLLMIATNNGMGNILNAIKSGIGAVMSKLLPLVAVVALLYTAWNSDFAGIKTNVTSFVGHVSDCFSTARKAVNSSVLDMTNTLNELNKKDDFFSGLTIAIMRVMVLFRALSEGWNDYTLSDDTFLKAKNLGILPLIEAIFDLKYRFGLFKDGFVEGWKEISNKVVEFIKGITKSLKGTIFESMLDGVTKFMQKLSDNDPKAWKDFGEIMGKLTAKFLLATVALKLFLSIGSKIVKIVSFVARIIGAFGKLGRTVARIIGAFGKLGRTVGRVTRGIVRGFSEVKALLSGNMITPVTLLGRAFRKVGTIVTKVFNFIKNNPVIMVITGIVTAVTSFVSMLKDGFSVVKEVIMLVGIAIATVGAILMGVGALPAVIVGAIVGAVATLIVVIKDHWQQVKEFFGNILSAIGGFFSDLWDDICTGVGNVVDTVKNFFGTIASWIYNTVIMPVVNFFMTYIYPIIEKVVEIVMKIIEIIYTLLKVALSWIYSNFIEPVIGFFKRMWGRVKVATVWLVDGMKAKFYEIVTRLKTAFNNVTGFVKKAWDKISGLLSKGANFISSKFKGAVSIIKDKFSSLVGFFKDFWNGIVDTFGEIGSAIGDTISGAVKGAINTVLQGAAGLINGFIKAINLAIKYINKIPGVKISKIELLSVPKLATGGIIEKPTLSLIGEQGKEAVMPLENNTGWISQLASNISGQISDNRMTPVNTNTINNQGTTNNNRKYMSSTTNTTNTTVQGDTDNSITFNQGAIQINVRNASEEEALRLANKIMETIKRKKELNSMMNYA